MTDTIVIIGGGIAGLATAFELAQRTRRKIAVIEAAKLGDRCTSKAAGLLTPVTEIQLKDDPFLLVVKQALARYPRFVADLTHNHTERIDYHNQGNLLCAFEPDGVRDLLRVVDFKKTLGFAIDELSQAELQHKEPTLSHRVQAAFFAPNEGCLDPIALIKHLRQELSASAQVRIFENCAVTAASLKNNTVESVTLSDGQKIACAQLVLASGLKHDIPELKAAFPLPLRPVKGEALAVQMPSVTLKHPVQVYHRYPVYLCPRANGEIVIGATSEEKSDEHTTAGAVLDLLFAAWQVLPEIFEHKLTRTWAGLRPTTPDNYPVAGRTNIDNLYCLLGLYRKGILLAPYLGEQLSQLILEQPTTLDWNLLRYDRF